MVRFDRNRALTPPVPGNIATNRLPNHFPPDVKDTIGRIEARLEGTSRRLQKLDFGQTTVAWEAPLDGVVSISGDFRRVFQLSIPKTRGDSMATLARSSSPRFIVKSMHTRRAISIDVTAARYGVETIAVTRSIPIRSARTTRRRRRLRSVSSRRQIRSFRLRYSDSKQRLRQIRSWRVPYPLVFKTCMIYRQSRSCQHAAQIPIKEQPNKDKDRRCPLPDL